ncbi:MAG: TraX family protein [Eubacteriales bacterium]|nr:TraX family protein [Eubacteriales bacterium]
MNERRLQTNLDTDFLKIIAIISMTVDHVGSAFFPQYPVFRWIGRLAFPIFCYCMTVGMLYTRDIKKYLIRLAVFAFLSQPVYVLAFNADRFWEEFTSLNIFFTLFVSLLGLWSFREKKWWLFAAAVLALMCINFDYAATGLILMLIFYLCRNKPWLGAALYVLSYLPALNCYPDDPLALTVAGHAIGFEIFCILAAPLIFLNTNTKIKISKWFFYAFYPLHLLAIYIVKIILA